MLSKDNSVAHTLVKYTLVAVIAIVFLSFFSLQASASEGLADVSSVELGTVYVQVDGTRTPLAINGRTQVSELLDSLDVTLGENDQLSKQLEQYVQKDDEIIVTRRGYSNRVEEGQIESKVIYTYSDDVTPGQEVVLVEGRTGHGKHVIRQFVQDGVVVEETVVESQYTVEPVDTQIAVGFKTDPISEFNFEWAFNGEKEPTNIVKVLKSQRSTAYTARSGALTATGREAMVGHVAVNPSVIPYGSKLFIQSSDGNFIYGYAIAADTGGAMLSGTVGVDLYFDTMGECVSFGVKNLDVYVLETP